MKNPFKDIFTKFSNVRADSKLQPKQPIEPLVQSPVSRTTGQLTEVSRLAGLNRYALADQLIIMDERLWSIIELSAIMVKKSYADIRIRPVDADDKELTTEEKGALDEAKKFAEKMDFADLLYHYTIDLWKYGDIVDQIRISGNGVEELIPLPMNLVTAVDKKSQINNALKFQDEVITNPKWYIVDERDVAVNTKMTILSTDRVLRISFNNRRNWVKDNLGRWTFNVWSNPPISSLYTLIEWKHNLIKNDVMWRNRLMPRVHWKLDLSPFDPSKYAGTHAQKLSSATTDASKAVDDFNETAKQMEADQAITTGMGVSHEMIEPTSTNYTSPNEIISQINSLISSPTGVPDALVGGESKGFTSLLHSTSFTALKSEVYAEKIKKALEDLMRRHVGIVKPATSELVLERLEIRTRLILDRDRTELSKIVANLKGANIFTTDELRAVWGFDPLTEDQEQSLIKYLEDTGASGNSPEEVDDDLQGQNPDSPTGDQESSEQRRRNSNQRGERRGTRR